MLKILSLVSALVLGWMMPERSTISDVALRNDKPLQTNDVVYVHASNGLTLRKTAAKDGVKMVLVPYDGSPLTVLAPSEADGRYVAETIGAFQVAGGWIKVKTSRGQEGFLFEGYLSRYKPLDVAKSDGNISMVDAFYRTISPIKGKRATLPKLEGTIERYQYTYADGARFEEQQYEGGDTQFLELPKEKFTMQEALALFRALWFQKEKTTATYEASKQRLTIDSEGGYSQLIIQPKGNRLVLQFSVAD